MRTWLSTLTRDDTKYALGSVLNHVLDDGLVHEDVVEHAAERVLRVVARRRVLDRLADRDPEAAGRVRIRLEDFLARLRVGARARDDLRAVRLHQHAPVRLLLIGDRKS